MHLGVLTILGGMILALVGLFAVWKYRKATLAAQPLAHRAVRWRTFWAVIILLGNFPVAGVIVAEAIAIHTSYTVTVINRSGSRVENVVLSGGGIHLDIGPLLPEQKARRRFWIQTDGALSCQVRQDGKVFQTVVEGYVTQSLGGNSVVTMRSRQQVCNFN